MLWPALQEYTQGRHLLTHGCTIISAIVHCTYTTNKYSSLLFCHKLPLIRLANKPFPRCLFHILLLCLGYSRSVSSGLHHLTVLRKSIAHDAIVEPESAFTCKQLIGETPLIFTSHRLRNSICPKKNGISHFNALYLHCFISLLLWSPLTSPQLISWMLNCLHFGSILTDPNPKGHYCHCSKAIPIHQPTQ